MVHIFTWQCTNWLQDSLTILIRGWPRSCIHSQSCISLIFSEGIWTLKSHECNMKSGSSGLTHVTTRLAIGLSTHGSILICSTKNRTRLVDTFFLKPMHLGKWYWDSKLCKRCCSRIYKREGKRPVAFTQLRLGFHFPQRSPKVSGKRADRWHFTLGREGLRQGNPFGL